MGESKLGDYFLRCGFEGMEVPTVRNEGRAIYIGPEQLPVLPGQPPVPPATSDLTVRSLYDLREISLPVPPGFCRYYRPLPVPPVEGRYHR